MVKFSAYAPVNPISKEAMVGIKTRGTRSAPGKFAAHSTSALSKVAATRAPGGRSAAVTHTEGGVLKSSGSVGTANRGPTRAADAAAARRGKGGAGC
jgi:hypothetical protein